MVEQEKHLVLEEILNEKQINHIVSKSIGNNVSWKLETSDIKPAVDGIAGFLGEHLRVVLHLEVKGEIKKVHLFLKRVPAFNAAKAEYVKKRQYFVKEHFMFKLMDEICNDGLDSWGVKPYIYTESMFVMPDLAVVGYTNTNAIETLDLEHILVTTRSLARFHAAFVNYETKKTIEMNRPYNTFQEVGHFLTEGMFYDCPMLTACVKVSANFVKTFSTKSYRNLPDLEPKLAKLYIEASKTMKEHKDTVNVILHKDLWVNNIMFKYENNVPVNAVFVDYQCLRYAPPPFDLMIFLYFTTDKCFRDEREKDIFDYYYSIFAKDLNEDSKKRLEGLGYDKESFLNWCEKARMMGMLTSMAVYPFVLMDSKTADKTFNDPETCDRYFNEDRSEPVLAHAKRCEAYKRRILAVTEEFVEKYLLESN